MEFKKISDIVKIWSPIIFGVVMFYVSFVKLEETVVKLDKVVENLTILTGELKTSVKINEARIDILYDRVERLEKLEAIN